MTRQIPQPSLLFMWLSYRRGKDYFIFFTGYYDCESSSKEKIENYALAYILKLTIEEIVSLLGSCTSLESVSVSVFALC